MERTKIELLEIQKVDKDTEMADRLLDFANKYAKEIGFDKTYIPTEFVGFYEKIKDIVNYGNGIDRLYVKELK